MDKFRGIIGFYIENEGERDCFGPQYVEKTCRGEIKVNNWQYQTVNDKVNSDVRITNRVSIIAKPFTYKHRSDIKYLIWDDEKWEVRSIEVSGHRLILTLGGVWHDGRGTSFETE